MTFKNIYIAPGTMLRIHLCTRDDQPLTKNGWKEQLRPKSITASIESHDHILLGDFTTRISYAMGRKDIHQPLIDELKADLLTAQKALIAGLSMPAELKIKSALARLASMGTPT